jgi:putative ABC transport system permease protein
VPPVYRIAVADGVDPVAVGDAISASLGPPARVEILDTGRADMEPLFVSLRLIAVVLLATAGINLLSTLLTASRETAGRTGVQLALGFTPRQVIAQGAVSGATLGLLAAVIGVPVGMLVFRLMADTVSSGIGVGPGWMPALPWSLLLGVAVAAVVVSGALGALAVRRIAGQPASDLVRGE